MIINFSVAFIIMDALKYELNNFGGAVIEADALPENINDFELQLKDTIIILSNKSIKVIWLNIPIEKSFLVNSAVKAGFIYHHADKDYLELTLKLVENAFIPPYATHYTGAGGVVVDDENNLLVVVEKYRNYKRHYKLPGGTLNKDEHISKAVCREVFEETGVKTEFQYLSAFRHWHGYRFGKSDIYFVCRLKPLSHDICCNTNELEEAAWIPVYEYLESDETHPFNKRIVKSALSGKGIHIEDIPGYGTPETYEMFFSG